MNTMRRIMACATLLAGLAACGGGGGGGTAAPGGPTSPPAAEAAIVFPDGIFFREAGQVFIGQRLTPSAVLPGGGSASWRIIGNPADPHPVFGMTADGNLNFVPGIGTYEIQVAASPDGPALAKRSVKVIPQQVEFVVEVQHRASGTTEIIVYPADTCFVHSLKGCETAAYVQPTLDGTLLPRLELPNGSFTPPSGAAVPAYVFQVPTSTLGPGSHALVVMVRARSDAYASVGGRGRQAFLSFDTTGPARVGALGILDANVEVTEFYTISTAGTPARLWKYVGLSASTWSNPEGYLKNAPTAYHLVQKPAGSSAAVTPLPADVQIFGGGTTLADALFTPDKPGVYTIEYVASPADGAKASPAYASVEVVPHQITLTLTVTADTATKDDVPVAAPGTLRVALATTASRGLGMVEALLDGRSLGLLDRTNLQRYPGTVCGLYVCPQFLYRWDIDKALLGSTTHELTIVVTDFAGFKAQLTRAVSASTNTEEAFGPFQDLEPR